MIPQAQLRFWLLLMSCAWPMSGLAESTNPVQTSRLTLGRLFSTPQNRILLDKLRLGEPITNSKPLETDEHQSKNSEQTIPRGPRYLTINGIVINNNGVSTIWLNDKSVDSTKGFIGENYQMRPTDKPTEGIQILLIDYPAPFRLLPGETLDGQEKKIRPTHEIPVAELKTAQRGGVPEAEQKPTEPNISDAKIIETQQMPPSLPHDQMKPLSPEEIFSKAKKIESTNKTKGFAGLLESVTEVTNAMR